MSARREKPDAEEIRAFLRDLPRSLHLGPVQRRWPQFIWHYSDIRNIANILISGRIYSRKRLKELGTSSVEIAQLSIINNSAWAHPYARLYFRPATPMQHQIEGIRSGLGPANAHCPVPVFLLFDSAALLTREGCWVSDMNLARLEAEIGDDIGFIRRRLSFSEIYHDGPLSEGEAKRRIIGARCAEVLFRDELDLDDLREIVCRTPGERTTLLTLLGGWAERWRTMIRVVYPGERMFFRDHAYVQQVRLLDSGILVEIGGRFSSSHRYIVHVRLQDEQRLEYAGAVTRPRFLLPVPAPQDRVGVQIELCGCLAFRGVLMRGGLLSV